MKFGWVYEFVYPDGDYGSICTIWCKSKIKADDALPAFLLDNNMPGYLQAINAGDKIRSYRIKVQEHKSETFQPKTYVRRVKKNARA